MILRGSALVPLPQMRYSSEEGAGDGIGVWMTSGGKGLVHLAFIGLV